MKDEWEHLEFKIFTSISNLTWFVYIKWTSIEKSVHEFSKRVIWLMMHLQRFLRYFKRFLTNLKKQCPLQNSGQVTPLGDARRITKPSRSTKLEFNKLFFKVSSIIVHACGYCLDLILRIDLRNIPKMVYFLQNAHFLWLHTYQCLETHLFSQAINFPKVHLRIWWLIT